MTRLVLHELTPQGMRRAAECLASGDAIEFVPAHVVPLREVLIGDLEAVRRAVRESELDRPALDGLLAPLIHEALPIGRVLAARREMWAWLGTTELWSVQRKRWPPREATDRDGEIAVPPHARILGGVTNHGLARLWWAAELTASGAGPGKYIETARFVQRQYVVDRLLKSQLCRNPTVLLGILDGLDWRFEWRRVSRVVTALGVLETTVCLDGLLRNEVASLAREVLDEGA